MATRLLLLVSVAMLSAISIATAEDAPQKLILIAGKPSHPPRMHEFNAGVQLLAKALADVPGVKTEVVLSGWPKDEKVFDNAAAVVFYMDGGGKHEAVKEGRRRLDLIDGWTKRGVGIGCMHYGVEVVADQAGAEFKRWIGGHFHDNWASDNFRKVVLNGLVWLTKAEVPAGGVESKVTPDELNANLDPK